MNGLEEILEYVQNCIFEKQQLQEQIRKIEERRTQLAGQRNEKKKLNNNDIEVNELGRQISELGNQSQELQSKLDSLSRETKKQVNLMIDNVVAESIRKIRIINQEIQVLEQRNESQKERSAKYQIQKEEFYIRFGRMPELSERAKKENELQEKEVAKNELEIIQMQQQIGQIEEEMEILAKSNKKLKNGNWDVLAEIRSLTEEIHIEELKIEEIAPIEELYVEDFGEIEELYVEEFVPIDEINVEEYKEEILDQTVRTIVNNDSIDEIEKLARAIIEEIAAEQTKDYNIDKNIQEVPQDIVTFEHEPNEQKSKVIIPLFGQKATVLTIVVKIEDGELAYKAQMSDDEEIKIYPSKLGEESVLLRDKQNRDECAEILINYAINEHKIFDKKVVNKIDPLICELLIECAEEYGHNAQELIYNYAMTFSNVESNIDLVPVIMYNLSYIETSNLSKKERVIIKKICKNARKNNRIDIIEPFSKFKKFKYILKRLFAINNIKVLPEAKY